MTVALIDADCYAYRAAAAAQKEIYLVFYPDGEPWLTFEGKTAYNAWKEQYFMAETPGKELPEHTVKVELHVEPVANCLHSLKHMIQNTLKTCNTDDYQCYLSGPLENNYRYKIDPTYKANRADAPRPVHLAAAKEYLEKQWDARRLKTIEADDAISIMGWHYCGDNSDFVVCSIDKDLRQIPGVYYDFVMEVVSTTSRVEAERLFYTQILTGDPVDNIPGVPKVGIKRAQKVLEGINNPSLMWQAVLDTHREKGLDTAYAINTASLVYLLRHKSEKGPWLPPAL